MQLTRWQRAGINLNAANRERMRRTGFTAAGDRVWTAEEDAELQRHYPDYTAASKALPHRTLMAIQHRAKRTGLTPRYSRWSQEELRTMVLAYRAGTAVVEIVPRLNRRSKDSVYKKAREKRVRRPARPPKLSGFPIMDEIRRRAFDLGFTMVELDAESRSGTCFSKPVRIRWGPISRALKVLGGRPVPYFPEKASDG